MENTNMKFSFLLLFQLVKDLLWNSTTARLKNWASAVNRKHTSNSCKHVYRSENKCEIYGICKYTVIYERLNAAIGCRDLWIDHVMPGMDKGEKFIYFPLSKKCVS